MTAFPIRMTALWLLLLPASALAQGVDPRALPSGSPLSQSLDPRYSQQQRQQGGYQQGTSGTYGLPTGTLADPTSGSVAQPAFVIDTERGTSATTNRYLGTETLLDQSQLLKAPPTPNEFEKYVERRLGRTLPRFGSELLLPSNRDFATPATATIPQDYIMQPGDVVAISMTGSIEGSVEREIDTDGKIFLPRVGAIYLAGHRYGDLRDRVSSAIGRQFRGYTVTGTIRRLRGIRVYVTGFANNPGAFTVNSLSTIANAIFSAGGPNSGGSFRTIKLYRRGAEVAEFDLYELVRGGSRLTDALLQNEDVLFIPAAGPQVAVFGSVHQEAIYEAKPGESLDQMYNFAGGANSLGDPSRIILYRNFNPRVPGPQQLSREQAAQTETVPGDFIQVVSQGSLTMPVDRQSVLVRIEGEVNRPGIYYVPPNTPMATILQQAGGLTPRAFAYGTKLLRSSVREQQRESYAEAIRQLEISLAAAPLTTDPALAVGNQELQRTSANAVLERLREAEPDGRVVMEISPSANTLPGDILLENNDTIQVPVRSSTVGVFGAVYRPASFLLNGERPLRVRDYVYRAGGPIRAADTGGIFVVRANGEVLSRKRGSMSAYVYPGDVVFVPIRTQPGGFWARFKEITSTLFQFGLTAATVASVTK